MKSINKVKRIFPTELVVDSQVFYDIQKPNLVKIFLFSSFNLSAYVLLCWIGVMLHNWLVWPLLWCFQGFIFSGFIAPVHECVHNNLSSSVKVNRLIGVVWSLPIILNFSSYKYKHLEHHKYTRIVGDTSNFDDYSSLGGYFLDLFVLNVVNYVLQLTNIILENFPNYIHLEKARRDIQIDNLALLGWIALVVTSTIVWTKFTFLFYWCPLLMSFPSAFLTAIPEHYGCDKTSNPLDNTRTTLSNSFVRCVMWNANYHAEHHVYPSVPSHNLPILHTLIGKYFQYQEQSYFLFHLKIIQGLLNKDNTLKKNNYQQ
ncbi:fatty acid desaturase [Microcoleus sp. AT3-A2]|uniref:fatty acid desaturase n=1 Tax=Microcoleus sp. AT3-A2 TaxID=2818610 RepID=UPI002FD0A725